MLSIKITVQNKFGLHTRAAAKLVALATKFTSTIQLQRDDRIANCKSIMALMLLGATKDIVLDLTITGTDEQQALDEIVQLFNNKFDEAE